MAHPVTDPPRWDTFGRLLQPVVSAVPVLTTNGNHEIEPAPDNGIPFNTNFQTKFKAYNARWPTAQQGPLTPPVPVSTGPVLPQPSAPASANSSGSAPPGAYTNLYHKAEVPGVATIIFISSYSPYDVYGFTQNSEQNQWLKKALEAVDRTATPWLLLVWHAPWYNSYQKHFMENECFRQAVELLLKLHSVDLVFTGHVHAYERSKPAVNFKVNSEVCFVQVTC
eukprot:gene3005-3286_t